ncbi:1-acyl-sn-glycerol-3-phosphate acyltransferase alpha-like [Sceloporus undulatus]|uniref:1-acyl-sn-glycerol-3-phosphate acyltransferase alpha-like n=1 Tax=Sceloporus undulatus TaxID=8520 RepID=UPI001C4BE02B|nr:1-acyl-sn-glycerol-3-phosphate acyltransferase alpha-like [Sceloporus undulatus]
MEQYQWILLLLTIFMAGIFLLYQQSPTFSFYCKMLFFNGWVFLLATILSPPLTVLCGRKVENMKIMRLSVLPLKYFYGIKLTVQGLENLNIKEPYVIVSNHQNCFDLLGMLEVMPKRCVTIAKKELLYLGPVGLACWVCGLIFIDRKKKKAAMDIMEHVAQIMRKEDLRVWIYPEGTRNSEDHMLPFKRGAFHLALKAQVPIVPIVTSSLKCCYSYKDKKLNPGNCTIRILPKIETQGLGLEAATALAESTRKLMQNTFYEISEELCVDKEMRQ